MGTSKLLLFFFLLFLTILFGVVYSFASAKNCTDSDNGKNPLFFGKVLVGNSGQIDFCDYTISETKVYEAYCTDKDTVATILMDCPSDTPYCNQGACSASKPICTDSDNGKNPFVKGKTTNSMATYSPSSTDYCHETSTGKPLDNCSGPDCSIREFYCIENYADTVYTDINCSNGCNKGTCFQSISAYEKSLAEELKGSENSLLATTQVTIECSGCILKDTCYPRGYRTNEMYCGNESFILQKKADETCNNNFECANSVCKNAVCVDDGFLEKILEFFRRLFG